MKAQRKAKKHEASAWLREHVAHQGDDCLIWPFFRDPRTGYGRAGIGAGRVGYAHRMMCEAVHGAPQKKQQAIHSCGNGHLGCVNPKHLSWGDNSINQLDRHKHGTFNSKGRPRFKLDLEKVAEIRALKGKMTIAALSKKYGVCTDAISKVLDGRSWNVENWKVDHGGFRTKALEARRS